MTFVRVIDFETTGVDPPNAEVIEVGWVDVFPNGVITQPRSMLCRPARPIPVEARAVHHLTDAEVAGGFSPEECIAALSYGAPVAFVAHNARFEASFWTGAPAPWICTYKAALRLWPDAPRHSNQVLRYWLNLDQQPGFDRALAMPPHRAAPDAYVTADILSQMLTLEDGANRLRRLLAWTREPGLLPKILFGKHRNSRWIDVPTDYLEWIGRQADMDEDVTFTARTEIERRTAVHGALPEAAAP